MTHNTEFTPPPWEISVTGGYNVEGMEALRDCTPEEIAEGIFSPGIVVQHRALLEILVRDPKKAMEVSQALIDKFPITKDSTLSFWTDIVERMEHPDEGLPLSE